MIQIKDLTKKFGKVNALNELNISIHESEATALWGSNGAGKTTLIRCLLGVIPFKGEIIINSIKLVNDDKEIKKLMGFVPQDISLHDSFSVDETINFYARIKKADISLTSRWQTLLGINNFNKKLVKELSGGMKQKLALAIALLSNPPILLLDEPTANLDLLSREEFLHLLNVLKKEGKTIIFSSHRMEEVLSFADRVLVLDNGKLIADSSPMEIYKKFGKNGTLKIYLSQSLTNEAIKILNQYGFESSMNGKGIKVKIEPDSKIKPIKVLLDSGMSIENFDYEVELF